MIVTAGLIGSAVTDSFGAELDFEDRIRIAAGLAASGLDQEGQAIAAIAAAAGTDAAEAYAEALDLAGPTVDEAIRIGSALRNNLPLDEVRVSGQGIIDALVTGMEEGLILTLARVEGVSAVIADRAVETTRQRLGIESPSKVFRQLGAFTGEGFALGLEDSLARVNSAGATLAGSSIPGVGTFGSGRGDGGRAIALLERIADRVGPMFGSLSFANDRDPGRTIEDIATRGKRMQRS